MIRGELRVALAGIVALVTLVAFEAMAVSTAMPVVADELGGLRRYGLAFSLFLTASLLGTVLAGGWADARGPRTPVVGGLLAFAGGLVLCGTAPTFTVLLVGRAVSGLGGGLLVVSLYAVVGAVFDEAVRPRVFAWISSAWGAARRHRAAGRGLAGHRLELAGGLPARGAARRGGRSRAPAAPVAPGRTRARGGGAGASGPAQPARPGGARLGRGRRRGPGAGRGRRAGAAAGAAGGVRADGRRRRPGRPPPRCCPRARCGRSAGCPASSRCAAS
ncbi:MAG: MFS transporter [Quadrisphaera sp.]